MNTSNGMRSGGGGDNSIGIGRGSRRARTVLGIAGGRIGHG